MRKFLLPSISFLATLIFLSTIHLHLNTKLNMLVAERFLKGAGWMEIFILSFYSGFLFYKMNDKKLVAKWRTISWLVFSLVFFAQLIMGILADERFLLSGSLHLPVPAMILAGPVYRHEISFMPILFLSTILLTGPAWCSQLCYFGAIDNWIAGQKGLRNNPLKHKLLLKHTFLFLVITTTILLRIFNTPVLHSAILGGLFGVIGILITLFLSKKKKKMINCIIYCPIGTVTSYLKYISPFRMSISNGCTTCMACTLKCRYDALNLEDIKKRRPGFTCTYCGDCITACHAKAIRYHFLGLKPEPARNLYLLLTISIHAAFIGLGRI